MKLICTADFFTLIRENTERDTREEVLQKLAEHFELN